MRWSGRRRKTWKPKRVCSLTWPETTSGRFLVSVDFKYSDQLSIGSSSGYAVKVVFNLPAIKVKLVFGSVWVTDVEAFIVFSYFDSFFAYSICLSFVTPEFKPVIHSDLLFPRDSVTISVASILLL